jgi:hypothetical protein
VCLIRDLFIGNIIKFVIKGSRMEEGIHVCPGMLFSMEIDLTGLYYSDYGGLKKRINAIEAEIEAHKKSANQKSASQKSASPKSTRFTFDRSKISFSGGPSPAPPTGDGGSTTVRFRQQGGNNRTTYGDKPGGSNTIEGLSPSSNDNVGWSTSREGGYGSFGRTPPLDQNTYEGPNSPPEMILPPPIKSISDLRINESSPTAEVAESTAPAQQTVSESPDKLQVCYLHS